MSTTLPSPDDALIGDPLYSQLKEHLVESTGMTYYIDKDADLVRRIGRRLSNTGARNCADYLDLLRDPVHGPSELEEMIAELTIGETYFFRHQEHFDALRLADKASNREIYMKLAMRRIMFVAVVGWLLPLIMIMDFIVEGDWLDGLRHLWPKQISK